MSIPKTAVVLSGGEGLRLRPITEDVPKGLVKVAGKPLLQWVIEWLADNGVSNLVIGVAHLKEKVMRYIGDGHKFGVNLAYSRHTVEGGTGEGFRLAISRYVTDRTFFALNGDQITDLRLKSLFLTHRESNALATVAVVHPRLPFGLVKTDKRGFCRGFEEKPVIRNTYCSSGIYVFQRQVLDYLPARGDVERITFPRMARDGRLKAYIHKGLFLTVNSLGELEEADEKLKWSRK